MNRGIIREPYELAAERRERARGVRTEWDEDTPGLRMEEGLGETVCRKGRALPCGAETRCKPRTVVGKGRGAERSRDGNQLGCKDRIQWGGKRKTAQRSSEGRRQCYSEELETGTQCGQ